MKSKSTHGLAAAALLAVLACAHALGQGQESKETTAAPPGVEQSTTPESPDREAAAQKNGEWVFAPIPVIDPTLGNGLALGAAYAVRLNAQDKVSPPSIFGVGGFRTSSRSWALLGGGKFFLMQDRFRTAVAAATVRANYDFYGIGNEQGRQGTKIPITQEGGGFFVGGQVRAFERWFVGPQYYYVKVKTSLNDENAEDADPIREVQFKLPVAALGVHVQRDSRTSQYYPRTGSIFDTKLYFSNKSVGALFTYQSYEVSFQQYHGLGERQVLAYRVKAGAVTGKHAPFFALCSLGSAADMRGYAMGRYRDRRILVGQAEYRRELWWRFGFAVFAGVGEVAPTFKELGWSNLRPGGGAGLRFTLAPKNHINLRVDASVGQGSHALYVGIGEAF